MTESESKNAINTHLGFMSRRLGQKSIRQMIKNHRHVHLLKQAQSSTIRTKVSHHQPCKSVSKLGMGGGFKQPWSERSMHKLRMLTPRSIQQLQNFDHMDVDTLIQRKDHMFDFQTLL